MIKIRNIHKAFDGNPILRGIDLDVDKGNVVVILGPSGSGKTTFLRCLNALEMPEQGMIEFSGAAPLKINFAEHPSKKDILALRRKTGMVFQQYNLFPHKTALENVMEGPVAVQGKSVAEAREQAIRRADDQDFGGARQIMHARIDCISRELSVAEPSMQQELAEELAFMEAAQAKFCDAAYDANSRKQMASRNYQRRSNKKS